MVFDGAVTFSNYRSIKSPLTIPFSKKITLIIGPNNVGKSNVLRFLAILWNRNFEHIDEVYDFPDREKAVSVTITASADHVLQKIANRPFALATYEDAGKPTLPFDFTVHRGGIDNRVAPTTKEVFWDYVSDARNRFLNDFRQASGPDANMHVLNEAMSPISDLPGTVYLPNLRFITPPGREPERFVESRFAGDTVGFSSVVTQLAAMDRPAFDQRHLKERLAEIGNFMAYCLERKSVRIEVPDGRKTIHLNIDGDERTIASLGTGVEQLLMIGLAAIGFGEKLVLIDEPELHLHPRSQKLIVKYLNERVEGRFVIATHSAAILDAIDADVVHLYQIAGGAVHRTLSSNRERYEAVRDLGHSPSELLQTRYAIWVEGPSDRTYLNFWIKKVAPELVEGVDYTILFYGGKVLSHHSFSDDATELVKAISLHREFAVVMDSDRTPERPRINATKSRIVAEVEGQKGFCWLTDGREIENYLPIHVIAEVQKTTRGVSIPKDKRQQVLDPTSVKKTDFANKVVAIHTEEWPLDLKTRVTDLVTRIKAAK
jgi:predicted ATPase